MVFLQTKSYAKNKRVYSFGEHILSIKAGPFSEEMQNNFDRVACPESVTLPLKCLNDYGE